jgi:hypothetical protein
MAADGPKDVKKEFNRVKDNAGLEHNKKDVPRQDHALRGASGTRPRLELGGPGASQSRREYKRNEPPQQTRDQKTQDADRSPNKSDASQKKQFHKRDLSEHFKDRSR